MNIRVEHGDCRDVARTFADDSIDACVTDPPYSLVSIQKRFGKPGSAPAKDRDGLYKRASAGFMGQQWDTGETAFDPDWWREVYRVLKPGAHLIAFSGTRTYHRLACAIEDAGFEIRDQLAWCYGSGFPKSHSVAKALGKMSEDEFPEHVQCRADLEAWDGWGTALKPAWEPIVLARKPLDGSVAANVLEHSTGALNIDACRVAGESPSIARRGYAPSGTPGKYGNTITDRTTPEGYAEQRAGEALGRWPANLCHDGSDEVLEAFAQFGERSSGSGAKSARTSEWYEGGALRPNDAKWSGDTGSAARFFFSAKAGKDDRIITEREEVTVSWTTLDRSRCQVTLQVDTEHSRPRVIAASASADVSEWSTFLFGSGLTGLYRKAIKSTIKTRINSTTDLKTWSWLTRSLTSDCIADANCARVSGGSHAGDAEKQSASLSFTLAETALLPNASHALSGEPFEINVVAKRAGHPTTKPVSLLRWLTKLVTPPGGTVLDPFAGSGTTGAACMREGFEAILVEREAEYVADIKRRLDRMQGLDSPLFQSLSSEQPEALL